MNLRPLFFLLQLLAPLRAQAIVPQSWHSAHVYAASVTAGTGVPYKHYGYGRGRMESRIASAAEPKPETKRFCAETGLRALAGAASMAIAHPQTPRPRIGHFTASWPTLFLRLGLLLLFVHRARGQLRAGWPRHWPIRPPPLQGL